jgi:threonine dehydrogenase-like Zn-dependent dehydrogenase
MGAVETIDNAAPDAVKQVMQATNGGAAAAIDFVGAPETMAFGVNVLRKGGKLVMVGLYGGSCPVSTVLFPFKMMTVEGSYVGRLPPPACSARRSRSRRRPWCRPGCCPFRPAP